MQHDRNRDRTADISFSAILLVGGLSLLALWWARPRLQGRQALQAVYTEVQRFEPRELPDFSLDGTESKLNPAALKGQWTLLYFAYSRCPDDCVATMKTLANLHRVMEKAGQDHSLRFVIISVATNDDEVQHIQDFARSFDSKFTGYVGTWAERQKLFTFFESAVDMRLDEGTNPYLHTANLFLLDPEAHYVATWNQVPDFPLLQTQICGFMNCRSK